MCPRFIFSELRENVVWDYQAASFLELCENKNCSLPSIKAFIMSQFKNCVPDAYLEPSRTSTIELFRENTVVNYLAKSR